jgi:hypothetical protein
LRRNLVALQLFAILRLNCGTALMASLESQLDLEFLTFQSTLFLCPAALVRLETKLSLKAAGRSEYSRHVANLFKRRNVFRIQDTDKPLSTY